MPSLMPSFSSIVLIAGLISSVFGQGNDKIGYSGILSSLSGGLQGTVSVMDPTTLIISNYELQDVSAPALYWWGATDGVLKDGFRISNFHVTTATTTPTNITIKLDAGKTTADFSTLGLWCERFGVNFGQATLEGSNGGGGADSTTASAASTASSTAASASTSTGAAVGMAAPASFGVLAGVLAGGLLF